MEEVNNNNSLNNQLNNNNSNTDLVYNNNEENEELEGKEKEQEPDQELEQEEEEDEEIDPSKEIALLYESLLEMFSKKQFKKILKTIVLKADKEEKYNLLEWKLLYLRSVTIHRILEKKNHYYYKT